MADDATSIEFTQKNRKSRWPKYESATLGLRNYWYPIFFTPELEDGKTRTEQVCGERLIFKRVDGKVYAIEDRCPHRGVPLSARPTCHSKNTITCWLHGFTFDVRDGELVQIVSDPDSTLIGRIKVRNYPVEETCGLVWVWIGDDEPISIEEELPDTFLPYHRGETDVAPTAMGRVKMLGNWRLAMENIVDLAHFYGHRTQQLIQQGFFAAPLSNTAPANPRIIAHNEPGRPQSFTFGPEGIVQIFEAKIEDQIVRGSELAEKAVLAGATGPTEDGGGPPSDEVDELVEERGQFVVAVLPAALAGGNTVVEFYTPIDEDYHMLIVVGLAGWTPGEIGFSLDPGKYSDVEREGFLNFDAFLCAKTHHAYMYEDWFQRERMFKGDSIIAAFRTWVEENARGFQRRDGNWTPMKALPEMEVIYRPPGTEQDGMAAPANASRA